MSCLASRQYYKMAKFNKEKDEILIESVQCYNALYNKSDKDHKNYIYKHKCWEKISDDVGLPVSECKKRWKSLRDQYNKKIKEGGGPELARINSTWEYMNLMTFLTDVSERRCSISTGTTVNDSECDNTQTSIPNTEVNAGWESEYEIKIEKRETSYEDIDDIDTALEGDPFEEVPSTSKKRKTSKLQKKRDKRESQRLNLLETPVSNTQTQLQSQPQSAIKKFFESMAQVVETFPPREQAAIRAKVCQLVSDTEIKLLK